MNYAEAVTAFRRGFDVDAARDLDTRVAWRRFTSSLWANSRITQKQWDTWDPPTTGVLRAPLKKAKRPAARATQVPPPSLEIWGITFHDTHCGDVATPIYAPLSDVGALRLRASWTLDEVRAGVFHPRVSVWGDWLPEGISVKRDGGTALAAGQTFMQQVMRCIPPLTPILLAEIARLTQDRHANPA